MTRTSAGILLHRQRGGGIEVFLVHPGGPVWARKDRCAWSIPKGERTPAEDSLEAARREFEEEPGLSVDGRFRPLQPVRQKGGKVVEAWAVEGDCDPDTIRSNPFEMEWPPKSGRRVAFPEVDRAAWFDIDQARVRIHEGQRSFLDELTSASDRGEDY